MTRRSRLPIVAILAILAHVTVAAQATPPPFGRVPKTKVRTVVSPVGGFQVEYPSSGNWSVLPGPAGAALAIGEYKKGEALVVIERLSLTEPLAADEMAPVAAREARIIKEREPAATGLSQQVVDADKRKIIVLQYDRVGLQGPERVVQYVVPQGPALYRVVCAVVAAQSAKYAPIFGHIAASIEPAAPPKPKK